MYLTKKMFKIMYIPDDGGSNPGGTHGQQPCDCGPCPICTDERKVSSPCIYRIGHTDYHQCEHGDVWEQATPLDPASAKCNAICPTCPETDKRRCIRDFIHYPPEHLCPLGHTW
ncbi:hypothetical protein COE93_04175 [Bacillus toyonensis]|nr:hypothetical protein CN589_14030 [Bacillus toyonensis]PFY01394.1 hypothetical protein COL45_17685 [Bacillus toyonensis]PHB83477.1 hypothetical protein COE93_04175 [Bacillus toyonensis]